MVEFVHSEFVRVKDRRNVAVTAVVGLVLEDGMLLVCREIQYELDRIFFTERNIGGSGASFVVVHSESEIVTIFFSSYGELRNTGNS